MPRKNNTTCYFRVAVRNEDGLLMFDPMRYVGEDVAKRQARTIRRMTGAEVQVRPA